MDRSFNPQLFSFETPIPVVKDYDIKFTNLPDTKYNDIPLPPFKTKKPDIEDVKTYPYKNILHNYFQETPFSMLYFSRPNIDEIQRRIRNDVFSKSDNQYKIGDQDEKNLINIMVNVYTTYAKNEIDTKYFKESISYLNDIVVKTIVPKVISNVKSYIKYMSDKTKPYGGADKKLLPTPEVTTITGTKMYL